MTRRGFIERPLQKTDFTAQAGLSLIEVVVTLFILSSAIVAIMPLFRQGLVMESGYENSTSALSIAQKKMESLRALAYDNLVSQAQTAEAEFPSYTTQVVVTSAGTLLKDVEVIVRWNSEDGISQTYSLATLRSDH